MGIHCEINLFKPSDGAFLPGEVVSGLIKYAVDEPVEVDRITTSLKGTGCVVITTKHGYKNRRNTYKYSEVYVDIDNIIQGAKSKIEVGSYEVRFCFNLPYNLPSSLNIKKFTGFHNVKCEIKYYIRIKFERPGFFTFNKRFTKEITVISGGTPRLSREPVIYGETKKLTKLFSSKDNIVQIKATILNSIIPFGGKIDIQYAVENNSSVIVKSVATKLVETYKFKVSEYNEVETEEDVPDTDTKTTSISCGDTQNMSVEINVPSNIHSLEYAYIVSRNYFVRIIAHLPMPHRNVVLNIPVQIGTVNVECACTHAVQNRAESSSVPDEDLSYNDPPPSYWEAMGETKTKDGDGSEEELDNNNERK